MIINKIKPIFFTCMLAITCVFTFTGCAAKTASAPQSITDFKLDTYVTIEVFDDTDRSVLEEALALCDKYEDIFSMQKDDSLLYKINEKSSLISPDTDGYSDIAKALSEALLWSQASDGRFQVSIGNVSDLWDFRTDNHTIPDSYDLEKAVSTVGDSRITLSSDSSIILPENTKIDLGAVAKGYIADRIRDYLTSEGVRHAIINLGGNVLCVGDKLGRPFNIGIRKPFEDELTTSLVLTIDDKSAVSSGISERYFTDDEGHLYHHILDPSTGFPYDNGLWQVTIISDDSLTGDCMSTAVFCLGLDDGMKLVEKTDNVEAIIITDDGGLHYSSGASAYIKNN